MSTLADNPMTLHAAHDAAPHAAAADTACVIGRRFVVSWSCTRRAAACSNERLLEHVMCIVALQPLDSQHAAIECWLESAGARQRTVLQSTTRPCAISSEAGLVHFDVAAANGSRLLTITFDRTHQRIVYAQSSLLHEAGWLGGSYDPPTLRALNDECVAQSA